MRGQNYEQYLAPGGEPELPGDDVEMERCYQSQSTISGVLRPAIALARKQGDTSCREPLAIDYKTHILSGPRQRRDGRELGVAAPAATGRGAEGNRCRHVTSLRPVDPTSILLADGNGGVSKEGGTAPPGPASVRLRGIERPRFKQVLCLR